MSEWLLSLLSCQSAVCDEPSKHWDNACVAVTALPDPEVDPQTDTVTFDLVKDEWSQTTTGTWEQPAGMWFPGFDDVFVRALSDVGGFYCVGTTYIDLASFEYREVEIQTTCEWLSF